MSHSVVVSTFPNAKALPLWAGVETGVFARCDLDVTIDETVSSAAQREGLASGEIHIAQAAVDNALAMILAGSDVVIVMGGESGMNDFIVQADIKTFADFRGRTLVVDSPHTAYALQARKLLAANGLSACKDYTIQAIGNARLRLRALLESKQNGGGVMNPPYAAQARTNGMTSLGRLVDLLGPYQAGGAFVLRAWARANAGILENYIGAYVEALKWIADPTNGAKAIDLLVRKLGITNDVARATLTDLTDPTFGFAQDAKLDRIGLANMLAIRAETEGENAALSNPEAYIDESYYTRAMGRRRPA
ncbi:MAG TPA: ABC transporter substrate-binding protein [Beijerinckiaceae bacterium]|nr:ABC transporter substrate-binding protein [Beijerinckiaceae bacterium]